MNGIVNVEPKVVMQCDENMDESKPTTERVSILLVSSMRYLKETVRTAYQTFTCEIHSILILRCIIHSIAPCVRHVLWVIFFFGNNPESNIYCMQPLQPSSTNLGTHTLTSNKMQLISIQCDLCTVLCCPQWEERIFKGVYHGLYVLPHLQTLFHD